MPRLSLDVKERTTKCVVFLKIPVSKHREADCIKKEDEDVLNMLSPGDKLIPILVARMEENFEKTIGKEELANFLINTLLWYVSSHSIAREHHSK